MRAFRGLQALAVASGMVLALAGLAPSQAQEGRTVVFAAASLKNALDDVNKACAADAGGATTISYAASSALARQIESGAPADIFISADLDWMKYLADRKLIKADSEVRLLGNQIALIASRTNTADVKIGKGFDLAGLLGGGRLAMADVKAVPAGKYGKAALETLGIWPSVEDKIAQAENVRAALKLVATGEAPLGIVYATDAVAEPDVKVIGTFPEDSHPPIVYPAALTAGSSDAEAPAFLKCMQTNKARKLFEAQGFTVLTPATN
jgi:molybdate transport system substrate-binding protein